MLCCFCTDIKSCDGKVFNIKAKQGNHMFSNKGTKVLQAPTVKL